MNRDQLERMSQIAIEDARPNDLVNIRDITIDTSLPISERMSQYLQRVKNPYCFLADGVPVRVRFINPQKPLRNAIKNYLDHQVI